LLERLGYAEDGVEKQVLASLAREDSSFIEGGGSGNGRDSEDGSHVAAGEEAGLHSEEELDAMSDDEVAELLRMRLE
jgi:hypothetical protein